MKYAVEMGSGAMTYIPGFMKTGSGIQNLKEKGGELRNSWLFNSVKSKTCLMFLIIIKYLKYIRKT
jgi:hypothetical protein